jgi:hypothetical protein
LDADKGDEARRLLLSETYKQAHDHYMVAELESPGYSVSVWSGGSDSISVLMYKAKFRFKERVGCTNNCSEKEAWREKLFPYFNVELYEFPSSLESYLTDWLFGENIVGHGRCTVRIAREDIEMIRNNNNGFEMNRSYVDTLVASNPFTCQGIRTFDKQLISIQSLFVMTCGEGFHWNCYSMLPDTMTIRSLRFILRAVVMGDTRHFVSMVLIDNQWLFYDGMGRYESGIRIPKLQVFGRNERPDNLDGFSMSCIFNEVQPIDETGVDLMSKDPSNVDQSNAMDNVGEGYPEPMNEENEENEDVGPAVDADFDDPFNEERLPNNQETTEAKIEDVGADVGAACDDPIYEDTILHEQDAIEVKIEDVSGSGGALEVDPFNEDPFEDNLSREETIQNEEDASDSDDRVVLGPGTTQDEYIQQSLNTLIIREATPKTREARSTTHNKTAKDPKEPSRNAPTRLVKETKQTVGGFGFVSRAGPKIRCNICRKTIHKGTCAIQYHNPNYGTGRTSHYHATIACLAQMTLDKQYEFAMKTWTESIPQHLAKDIAEKMSKGMDKIVHLNKK